MCVVLSKLPHTICYLFALPVRPHTAGSDGTGFFGVTSNDYFSTFYLLTLLEYYEHLSVNDSYPSHEHKRLTVDEISLSKTRRTGLGVINCGSYRYY